MTIKTIVALSALASLAAGTVPVSAQDFFHAVNFEYDFGAAGFRVPIEARLVKGAPYSAEIVTESLQILADGNRIVQRSTARVYRDSEGRLRREEDRPSGDSSVSITDPVAGVSFSLDPANRLAFQTPNMGMVRVTEAMQKLHETAMRLPLVASENVERDLAGRGFGGNTVMAFDSLHARGIDERVEVVQLPARDIEGVKAEGVRRTTTIAAGAIGNELPIQVVSEEWRSPELQVLVLTERSDPRVGTSSYRLLNITRTEPPAHLFEVPADYTVRQPVMMKKLELDRPGQ
jgi:hypothetical protein